MITFAELDFLGDTLFQGDHEDIFVAEAKNQLVDLTARSRHIREWQGKTGGRLSLLADGTWLLSWETEWPGEEGLVLYGKKQHAVSAPRLEDALRKAEDALASS